MTWLIKFKDGRYVDGDGNRRGRAFAHEYAARHQAYEELANSWSRHEAEPRIVRLKPRAKLDEAAIRRAERERIAGSIKIGSDGYVLEPGDGNSPPVSSDVIFRTKKTSIDALLHLRNSIIALDWPKKP